jgi:hypothetical protein
LTSENPYGSVPSEGACFLLLASEETIPEQAPIGQILSVFRSKELEDITRPRGIIGRGLAKAFRDAAGYAPPDRLISDLNGERWRAEEFGFAVSAAGAPISDLASIVETPALYLGDCGVAAGPIFAALALVDSPEQKKRATGPVGMISMSSRGQERAIMFLERYMMPTEEAA